MRRFIGIADNGVYVMAVKLVIYGSDNLLKKDVVKICNDNSDQFITGICFMMVMLWPEIGFVG